MSDITLPIAVVGALFGGIATGARVMWGRMVAVQDGCDGRIHKAVEASERKCAGELAKLSARVDTLEQRESEAEERHRAREDELTARWVLEVQLGARRALQPRDANDPPPASLEPPPWEETTAVTRARSAVERAELDRELEAYARKTTPPDGTPAPLLPPRPGAPRVPR